MKAVTNPGSESFGSGRELSITALASIEVHLPVFAALAASS